MLKSIEEKVDEQWVQEQKQRYTYKGFQEKLTVQDNMLNYSIEVNWDQSSKSGKYTSEDFEKQIHQKHLDTLVAEFKSREFRRWLRDLILQIPNDQELGAAVREWYNKTEGKFI